MSKILERIGVRPRRPVWVDCPQSLQIDTLNYCNASCVYCNVKAEGAFGIPRGRMETDMVEYIIRYWGRFKDMELIAPFMNGDPLLDDRLLHFFDYTQLFSKAYNVIDSNGIAYHNKHLMVHSNLKIVRFTISASSRKTYELVHGVDKFSDVLRTVDWLKHNKMDETAIQFHFIVNRYNEHEIDDWIERFDGYKRKIFPLHRMEGIQHNSEGALGVSPEWIVDTSTPEKWAKTRPVFIEPDGRRYRSIIPEDRICQGMSFAVQWDGKIVHCTDAPTEYNYGHVYDVDMLEAWHKRNRSRLTNPACIACNSKRPDWEELTRRFLKRAPEGARTCAETS